MATFGVVSHKRRDPPAMEYRADHLVRRDTAVVWAGEGVDMIHGVETAATLVARISAEAEAQLEIGAKIVH